jgi:hypothetical protein
MGSFKSGSSSAGKPVNEHIEKILSKSIYGLNEAKYSLAQDLDEDDVIPEDVFAPRPVSKNDSNVFEAEEDEAEMPEDEILDKSEPTADDQNLEEPSAEESPMAEPTPEVEQPKDVNSLQNEIIRTNVSAMEKMNAEIKKLNSALDNINSKITSLDSDVEEVKEPTPVQKFSKCSKR